MLQPRDASKGRTSFHTICMRACFVMLLLWLVFYTLTSREVSTKTTQTVEPWNMPIFFRKAIHSLQSAIKQPQIPRGRKLVLLWTDYFSEKDWLPSTTDLRCPVTECDTTSDRSLLKNSSAVILHLRNTNFSDLPKCNPSNDSHCPLWVLFNKEAPPNTNREILEVVEGMVHWTATYRKDSDLIADYGTIVRRKKIHNSTEIDFDPNKRLLCWLVSNCHTDSKREDFVSELQRYIKVDIYGRCGDKKCPHTSSKDCYKWLSSRCHFYLSLENSNCKDYVTEKLYYALMSDMVPVVLGHSDNYKHLPPRSYINALDFSSPKELAKYLVSLVTVSLKDKETYLSYFRWKRDFEVKDRSYLWYCDLCKKLHETKIEEVKPRSDLVSWWFNQSNCTSWNNL